MTVQTPPARSAEIRLSSPASTERLAQHIGDRLEPGDCLLISGPIGAGKSHLCRAIISHLLHKEGRDEEVPSPTYTLVQTYLLRDMELWHADLYRLSDPSQAWELGLDEAFETAVVLVEWPDRLGDSAPNSALRISLAPAADADARTATLGATDRRWNALLASIAAGDGTGSHA